MARKPKQPRTTPLPLLEHEDSDSGSEADRVRQFTEHWAPFNEREFKRTKNPIFAWDAIGDHLRAKLPIPSWASDYLRAVSRNVIELTRRPYEVKTMQADQEIARRLVKAPGPKQIAPAIASAMGFIPGGVEAHILKRDSPKDDRVREKTGRFNPLRPYAKAPASTLAVWVRQQVSCGASVSEAQVSAMQTFGVSKRTVERACTEHRNIFKPQPAKK